METDHPAAEDGTRRPPRPLRRIETVFLIAAALLLLSMMLLTFLDVVGRYFFNAPLGFAFEMTQLAMAGLVFTALPAVTLRGSHITAGLFDNAFAGRMRTARDVLVALIVATGCGFLAWRMSSLAERFVMFGDVTSVLRFPIGLVAWLGVGCLIVATLAALATVALVLRGPAR